MTESSGDSVRRRARREFLRFLAASPLLSLGGCHLPTSSSRLLESPDDALNVFEFEAPARERLERLAYNFLQGGSDDEKTLRANREDFDRVGIRARRLIDVSHIDTSQTLLGRRMETPLLVAPVGLQGIFHDQGEVAAARGASAASHQLIASTLSSRPIAAIAEASNPLPWFQLYTTPDRGITKTLIDRAIEASCQALVVTVDTPVLGNRENHAGYAISLLRKGEVTLGNFQGIELPETLMDATLDWQALDWIRAQTDLPLLVKGIVTREDAALCRQAGLDGVIVSNHGGRQEESLRGTLSCLPEVVEAIDGSMPVIIDGGFRRGTDIFKALALGADAVAVGRPYLWGLASFGAEGVERVLNLLRAELVRIMQLAGTPSIQQIGPNAVEELS